MVQPDVSAQPDAQATAMLRLLAADGVGVATARRLLACLGSPERVLVASRKELEQLPDFNATSARLIVEALAASDPENERGLLARYGGRFVPWDSAEYPQALCEIPDPPTILRLRGPGLDPAKVAIAIVGTRRCSAYGRRQAARFSAACASAGYIIVSGGARGIDAAVHRAAIQAGGLTVAVLGSGLAHPYPPEHEQLFDEIVSAGGTLLTEYATDRTPRPGYFPRRNRLVSGLSVGVLIIEAPRRSGAMITARLAVEDQGREAWAVPGTVEGGRSDGGHRAITEGWAGLIDSPEALFQWLDDRR